MIKLDYKGWRGSENLVKSDYVICERALTHTLNKWRMTCDVIMHNF